MTNCIVENLDALLAVSLPVVRICRPDQSTRFSCPSRYTLLRNFSVAILCGVSALLRSGLVVR